MTLPRIAALEVAAAIALGLLAGGAARAAAPARKAGTVKVTVTGAKKAAGTFPAICGAYFMADVPGIAKAGDGLVFEADVAGVGHLQLNSQKRLPGKSSSAGLVLNTTDGSGSFVGDASGGNEVVFGPKLDTAKVRAKLKNLRFKPGAPPDVVTLEARFDCSK